MLELKIVDFSFFSFSFILILISYFGLKIRVKCDVMCASYNSHILVTHITQKNKKDSETRILYNIFTIC